MARSIEQKWAKQQEKNLLMGITGQQRVGTDMPDMLTAQEIQMAQLKAHARLDTELRLAQERLKERLEERQKAEQRQTAEKQGIYIGEGVYTQYDPINDKTYHYRNGQRVEVIEGAKWADPNEWEVYTDAEGRRLAKPKAKGTVTATITRSGHVPIQWLREAFELCDTSDYLIRIELEKEGVTVIAENGDDYMSHTVTYAEFESGVANPLIEAINKAERYVETLGRAKSLANA